MTFLMKDDVKDEVPNETPKTLIFFDGVLEFGGRPKGDYVTHFCSWIERPITHNLV